MNASKQWISRDLAQSVPLGVLLALLDPFMYLLAGGGYEPHDLVWLFSRSIAVWLPIAACTSLLLSWLGRWTGRRCPERVFLFRAAVWGLGVFAVFIYLIAWQSAAGGQPGFFISSIHAVTACLAVIAGYVSLHRFRYYLDAGHQGRRWGWMVLGAIIWIAGWSVAIAVFDSGGRLEKTFPAEIKTASSSRPNVLLIVLDTVRRDHMSCYGYGRETTPNIDAFSRNARIYDNVMSPGSWTIPTHASFFTGLPESAHGCNWGCQALNTNFYTLAEQLRDAGYQTVGLAGNVILSKSRQFHQGFDVYACPTVTNRLGMVFRYPTVAERVLYKFVKDGLRPPLQHRTLAAAVNQALGRWFANDYNADDPFFVFLNYIDPHAPYLHFSHALEWASEEIIARWSQRAQVSNYQLDAFYEYMFTGRATISSEDMQGLKDLYDEEIYHVDNKVGELFDFMESSGLMSNTMIIVVADHGEHFGEHHMMGHQYSVYEPLVRVPLIVRYDPLIQSGREAALVQSHDIYPTVLEAAGLPWERKPAHNCYSLLEKPVRDRHAVAEYLVPCRVDIERYGTVHPYIDFSHFLQNLRSMQVNSNKVIWFENGRTELYRLNADPMERENLSPMYTHTVEQFGVALTNWLNSFSPYDRSRKRYGDSISAESEQDIQKLRSLGYTR